MDARLHQGLVVLAGALLVASALGAAACIARAAGLPDSAVLAAGVLPGAVMWLVACPVLVGVPRMLGLAEAPDAGRWATLVLWAAGVLGALFAVVEVVGFGVSFVSSTVGVTLWDRLAMWGTAMVAAAVAAFAFAAVTTRPPDA